MTPDEDMDMILARAGLDRPPKVLEPAEKTMMGDAPAGAPRSRPEGAGSGKPHYTRILVYRDKVVFAVGCCKPLTILHAEFDGRAVDGETILAEHSSESGGKLLYGINETGNRLVLDLKRGDSTRFQRLTFEI